LWTVDGDPGENTGEIVRVLENVLAREPLHAGANHYYIHAMEASPNPERALPSAQRLETMVPKAGHLVHMPAYAKEAEQTGGTYDLMYHSLNKLFLAYAASMEGRYAEAKRAGEAMEKRLIPHGKTMPMLDAFMWTAIWIDMRFAKWDALLARPEPANERKISHLMWRYSRAISYAGKKETSKAGAESAMFAKEAAALPPGAALTEMNAAGPVLAVANEALAARLAAADGKPEAAIQHWRSAVVHKTS
jgi:hypothetical protein